MADDNATEQDVVLAMLESPEQVKMAALMGRLMSANHRDYAAVTNALVESLQHQLAVREAELGAIRTRINELFAGDYMPTESAIQQAVFYPSKALMARRLRERSDSSEGAS